MSSNDDDLPPPVSFPLVPAGPAPKKIGWLVVNEYSGTEIHPYPGDDFQGDLESLPTIKVKEDLKVGDHVLVWGLAGRHKMTVGENEDGSLFASKDSLLAVLEFGKDDRECWVCGGLINTRGLRKLSLSSV